MLPKLFWAFLLVVVICVLLTLHYEFNCCMGYTADRGLYIISYGLAEDTSQVLPLPVITAGPCSLSAFTQKVGCKRLGRQQWVVHRMI